MNPKDNNSLKSEHEQPRKVRLGEYLISKGKLNQVQLQAALAEQRITQERLGMILTRGGFITRKDLIDAILATNPDEIHGESHFSARVPYDVLIQLKTMIVNESKTRVHLATMSSEAQVRVDLAQYYPDLKMEFVATNLEQLKNYLQDLNKMLNSDDSLIDKLLRKAFAQGASDIHIMPRYSSYTVMFRHLGVRQHVHEGTLDEYNTLAARVKDLSRMDIAERRIPQDGGFQMEYNGKLVDLRVATVPTGTAETIVIRLLDPDKVQPTLDGLGISNVADWRRGVSRNNGLCLICGPTGSGKTTTLNATLKEMDRFGKSIYTLEDPVEFRIPYIAQVNVNHALNLDFARGIRAFMRADPDVIVVGEIRDTETARNAVKAGETGHLVLGTLHTKSITSTIDRMRDLGVPDYELTYLLRSVMVQQLIRTLCTHCHGEGCQVCMETGYSARTIISECVYLKNEDDVRRLIRKEVFWKTILEDAVEKFRRGITDEKEVSRVFGEEAEALLAAAKAELAAMTEEQRKELQGDMANHTAIGKKE